MISVSRSGGHPPFDPKSGKFMLGLSLGWMLPGSPLDSTLISPARFKIFESLLCCPSTSLDPTPLCFKLMGCNSNLFVISFKGFSLLFFGPCNYLRPCNPISTFSSAVGLSLSVRSRCDTITRVTSASFTTYSKVEPPSSPLLPF